MVPKMQLTFMFILCQPLLSFATVGGICANPDLCPESSGAEIDVDVVSLIQTRSTASSKPKTTTKIILPQEGSPDGASPASLLELKSSLGEYLPEGFFQEGSVDDPVALAGVEGTAFSRIANGPSMSSVAHTTARKSIDASNSHIPSSYVHHTASVLDSNGNHSELLLQTSLTRSEVQDALAGDKCTPKCTWKCATSKCDEVCEPKCHAPLCETRCSGMETSSCLMECEQPECAVICPPTQCTTGCAKCETTCSKPQCKLKCPGAQPCRNVCEEPKCEWQCQAPKYCPAPECQLQCEKPANCTQTYHQPLPPLQSGEVSITSFRAVGEESKSGLAMGTPCTSTTVVTVQGQLPCDNSVMAGIEKPEEVMASIEKPKD